MLFIRYILFVLFLISFFWAHAQKEDYYWLMGYQSPIGKPDTGYNVEFGNIEMDFNFQPINPLRKLTISDFNLTNTSISDKNGNLLFYTNGTKIFNRNYQIIQNGDSINAGYFQFEWDSTIKKGGYRTMQGAIILPLPENDSLYYLLHLFVDSSHNGVMQLYDSKLLHTLVNIKANNGLGKVIYKDSVLIKDTFSYFISACKMANGKDWWIFVLDANTEYLHKLSLTKTGLKIEGREKLGRRSKLDLYQACFSPDGKKFILFEAQYGLSIYNFDRCRGSFSNPQFCPIPEIKDSSWFGLGISISTNSRLAYATATRRIFQYDLSATNISSSKEVVAIYDGYYDRATLFRTQFNVPQLAPDGRIYISTGSATRYLHIIDKPNEKGLACNVIQHGLKLPTWNRSIPYFPHYRMGTDSSSCKSGIEAAEDIDIKVYPNPASDYIDLVCMQSRLLSGMGVVVEFYNLLGQQFYPKMDDVDDGLRIDVKELPKGVYLLKLLTKSDNKQRIERIVIH
jgi:hypothetical protein